MSPDTDTLYQMETDGETRRLATLRSYCIVDTGEDPALDALTRAACKMFAMPIALVSLIEADRVYFKSKQGLGLCDASRSNTFCSEMIKGDGPLVVLNATSDERFSDNPYVVGDPFIRFYAGVPLTDATGEILGAFCIMDTEPRGSFSDQELASLKAIAAQAAEIISDNYPLKSITIGSGANPAQLFRSFIRDVPMAAAMVDENMTYLAVSRDWYRVFGLAEDNLIGRDHFEVFPNLSAERRELLRSIIDFGAVESGREMMCEKADGTSMWMRCDSLPWYTETGAIGGAMLFRKEIDDEILARTEAGKTQRLFETFFFHNPTHMYLKSLDGEYTLYNKAFAIAHDIEASQAGLRTGDLYPEATARDLEEMDAAVLKTSGPVQGHIDIFESDEIQQRLEVRKFPVLNDNGDIWAIGGVSVDITEQYNTEVAFRQATKMEAVGNLTGGIAHDFNNILAVILGNLQLMQRHVADDSKEGERLSGAMNATLRGADLTKQLLAFSRRQELEPSVIDVNDTLQDLHKMISRTLSEAIDIDLVLSDDLPKSFIDEGQFQNCVLNLSINARDAMNDDGTLQIETKYIEIADDALAGLDGLSAGEYIVVSITDDGCGMSKQVRERVFEPFFTTKGVGKGTGLGLAMVYGFIKQSRGHVSVYSEVGVGTTVRMYLPVASSENQVEEATMTEAMMDGEGKILVVEDDDGVRAIVQAMLGDIGYDIDIAASGAEAVNMLENEAQYDLVFSDVIMPGGMTGVDLARIVAQRWPEIPVLLTSGYPRDAVKSGAAVHILPKPYQQHELASEITKAIAAHKEGTS